MSIFDYFVVLFVIPLIAALSVNIIGYYLFLKESFKKDWRIK